MQQCETGFEVHFLLFGGCVSSDMYIFNKCFPTICWGWTCPWLGSMAKRITPNQHDSRVDHFNSQTQQRHLTIGIQFVCLVIITRYLLYYSLKDLRWCWTQLLKKQNQVSWQKIFSHNSAGRWNHTIFTKWKPNFCRR